NVPENPESGDYKAKKIRRAINARRIMSDDITWISPTTPDYLLPINIWWPGYACPEIYEKLAHIRPDMLNSCLRACIVADYQESWDRMLLSLPDEATRDYTDSPHSVNRDMKLWRLSEVVTPVLWMEANASRNDHYLRDISAAVPDKLEMLKQASLDYYTWMDYFPTKDLYFPPSTKYKSVCKDDPIPMLVDKGAYDGIGAKLVDVEFAVFARDAIGLSNKIWEEQEKVGSSCIFIEEMYEALHTDGSFK